MIQFEADHYYSSQVNQWHTFITAHDSNGERPLLQPIVQLGRTTITAHLGRDHYYSLWFNWGQTIITTD